MSAIEMNYGGDRFRGKGAAPRDLEPGDWEEADDHGRVPASVRAAYAARAAKRTNSDDPTVRAYADREEAWQRRLDLEEWITPEFRAWWHSTGATSDRSAWLRLGADVIAAAKQRHGADAVAGQFGRLGDRGLEVLKQVVALDPAKPAQRAKTDGRLGPSWRLDPKASGLSIPVERTVTHREREPSERRRVTISRFTREDIERECREWAGEYEAGGTLTGPAMRSWQPIEVTGTTVWADVDRTRSSIQVEAVHVDKWSPTLGTWHTHPDGGKNPSRTDKAAMVTLLEEVADSHVSAEFLCIIATKEPRRDAPNWTHDLSEVPWSRCGTTLTPWVFQRDDDGSYSYEQAVLEGEAA